jgi:hypothetical protein
MNYYVRVTFFNKLLFLVILTTFIKIQHAFAEYSLPESIEDGFIQYSNQLIDSLEWSRVLSRFDQSYSVPDGELEYLIEILPELRSAEVPYSEDALQKYEPWDEEHISSFFKDFPQLLALRPILDFKYTRSLTDGSIILSSRKSDVALLSSNSAQFNVKTLNRKVNYRGRVKFTDENAWWTYRRLSLIPCNKCQIQLGNFSFDIDQGLLFSGYSLSDLLSNSFEYNWLIGENGQWNGVRLDYSIKNSCLTNKVISYVHRNYELISFSVNDIINISNKIQITLGAVGNKLLLKQDTTGYVYGGLEYLTKGFTAELFTGCDIENHKVFPFRFSLNKKNELNRFMLMVNHYPHKSYFPYSQLSKRMFKITDDTMNASMTSVSVSTLFKQKRSSVNPELVLLLERSGVTNCQLNLDALKSWDNLQVSFNSYCYLLNRSATASRMKLQIHYSLPRYILLNSISSITIKNKNNFSFNSEFHAFGNINDNVSIDPFIKVNQLKNKNTLLWFGYTQVIEYFKGCGNTFTFEIPLKNEHVWEECRFVYKASFEI